VDAVRNRQKQRALRRAGIRREETIGARNAEHYSDPTPCEAVKKIIKEAKGK
jgi:hypothetical protein